MLKFDIELKIRAVIGEYNNSKRGWIREQYKPRPYKYNKFTERNINSKWVFNKRVGRQ